MPHGPHPGTLRQSSGQAGAPDYKRYGSSPSWLRHFCIVFAIEIYAFCLAYLQSLSGVRTDEAKYLLNIPYPHPPAGRFVLHLLETWSAQELFWRVVLATLLVQAVWIVWSMARSLPSRDRLSVCGLWLCSAALVTQGGSIMLAPLTALQGLLLVALFLRRDIDVTRYAGWLGVFWGIALFTAFQAILYVPLVIALYARTRLPRWFQAFCVLGPIALLALYVLGHPLAAASFLLVRGDNAGFSVAARLAGVAAVWGIAGSVWGSILGIAGILAKRSTALLWTAAMLSAYVWFSYHDYYAILFLPLVVAGLILCLRQWPVPPIVVLAPCLLATVVLFPTLRPPYSSDPARAVSRAIAASSQTGSILIAGPFGHQWQYESMLEILRYRPGLLSEARAVVCLRECPEVHAKKEWVMMKEVPVEVWVRKN